MKIENMLQRFTFLLLVTKILFLLQKYSKINSFTELPILRQSHVTLHLCLTGSYCSLWKAFRLELVLNIRSMQGDRHCTILSQSGYTCCFV